MRKRRGERGAILVEFVLILPVFLLLVFGGIDMSLVVNSTGTFRSGVQDGASLIADGDYVDVSAGAPCLQQTKLQGATGTNTVPSLCEVTNAIGSVTGLDASSLQIALACLNNSGQITAPYVQPGQIPCNTPPTSPQAPTSINICARANLHSVTGLLAPMVDNLWASATVSEPLTGNASTVAANWDPSYNSTAPTDSLVCPPAVYTVTYSTTNSDGTQTDSGSVAPVDANSPYLSGSTVTVLDDTGLSYNHEAFDGWCTTKVGNPVQGGVMTCETGMSYTATQTFPITGDVTLYPMWGP